MMEGEAEVAGIAHEGGESRFTPICSVGAQGAVEGIARDICFELEVRWLSHPRCARDA